ncbi:MAG: nuclear transport factor 2 family protein [Draconibacterium sp.]|nr:nuclear transport factor 2 family protein [Draconibacterium sp.]
MKINNYEKILLLIIPIFLVLTNNAQEKSGTVYIQHPAIETTRKLWSAFEKGDITAVGDFFADSLVVIFDGSPNIQGKGYYLNSLQWMFSEFENLKVVDDSLLILMQLIIQRVVFGCRTGY